MNKTRLLGLITALLVAVSAMGVPAMEAEAAGCSNWMIDFVYQPFCIEEGCGFLSLKSETHYQIKRYKRTCVSNSGEVTTEYDRQWEKLGCC